MAATVAFGGVRHVNLSGDLPFSTVCHAVENVYVRMAVCHLGNFAGGFGRCARGMIMVMLGFMIMLRFFGSCVCALALTLERETHVISLVRVDAVPLDVSFVAVEIRAY
jgi:hypothetical protein